MRRALKPSQTADPSEPTPEPPPSVLDATRDREGPSKTDSPTYPGFLVASWLVQLHDEIDRLTHALHANHVHPDWEYLDTTGPTQTPPYGPGWQPNPEDPGHSLGRVPRLTWCWRRRLDGEPT